MAEISGAGLGLRRTSAEIRQRAFAAHLRDPDRHAPPADIDPARVAVYRDLFFNNVEGLLASFFPVIRSLYGQEDWLALARAFYAQHRSHTPYFLEIAGEFVGFLESAYAARPTRRACANWRITNGSNWCWTLPTKRSRLPTLMSTAIC